MKKNIGYGIIFSLIILSGCFIFYIFYQETYIKLDNKKIEVKVDDEYWTANDVTVTVNYNDKDIKIKSYSFDGGKTWQSENKYVAKENGILSIVLKSSNNKKSKAISYSVNNIDKDKPEIVVNDIIYVAVGTNLDIDNVYKINEPLSGIKGKVKVTSEQLDFEKLGVYEIEIYALDHALNSNTKAVIVEVVEKDNPNLVKEEPNKFVSVTGLTLEKTKISLVKGTSVLVSTIIKPLNATNKKIAWKSSNPAVATVDATGKVTAISSGSATITATTADGNKSSDINVVVTNERVEVASIFLDQTQQTVTTENTQIVLIATIAPDNATDQTVIWNTSNTKVATISNGVINIKGEGSATITATSSNGKIATFKLTVKDNYIFQERVLIDSNTGNIKGYSLKIYKNGVDITSGVSNILSPFSATNEKKRAEIDITMSNHNQLKDSISFMYNNNKYTANK